jgi:hypothetical protein
MMRAASKKEKGRNAQTHRQKGDLVMKMYRHRQMDDLTMNMYTDT